MRKNVEVGGKEREEESKVNFVEVLAVKIDWSLEGVPRKTA